MTMILSNQPKQYQELAKSFIQQTVRNNISGRLCSYFQFHFEIATFFLFVQQAQTVPHHQSHRQVPNQC